MQRRRFLYTLGATAACGVVGAYALKRTGSAAPRYFVPSAEGNDLDPSAPVLDFSAFGPAAVRRVEGFSPRERTLATVANLSGVRRVYVPGLLHASAFHGERILTVTRGEPSIMYALDADTLEIVASRRPPEGFVFGGHITRVDSSTFALTLNTTEPGRYDAVGFFDGSSLRETGRFSSYGFQAHDLKFSPDRSALYIGHYGSHFQSGPYRKAGVAKKTLGVYPATPAFRYGPD